MQYLATLADGYVMPYKITSDRGGETIQAADAYYRIASQLRQRDNSEPLQFTDCFRYGISKQNPRIKT